MSHSKSSMAKKSRKRSRKAGLTDLDAQTGPKGGTIVIDGKSIIDDGKMPVGLNFTPTRTQKV